MLIPDVSCALLSPPPPSHPHTPPPCKQGSQTTSRDNSHIVVGYAAKGEAFGCLSNKVQRFFLAIFIVSVVLLPVYAPRRTALGPHLIPPRPTAPPFTSPHRTAPQPIFPPLLLTPPCPPSLYPILPSLPLPPMENSTFFFCPCLIPSYTTAPPPGMFSLNDILKKPTSLTCFSYNRCGYSLCPPLLVLCECGVLPWP